MPIATPTIIASMTAMIIPSTSQGVGSECGGCPYPYPYPYPFPFPEAAIADPDAARDATAPPP